ncbi:hypothetical protein [Pontiella sp.]|uniref:hypothetical protein n=1 Tax=Pontiella sp. TaxID=2837462 RepID=UPI003567B0D7
MFKKIMTTALLTGLTCLQAQAGFEQFTDPSGGMWVTPENGDPAFGIFPFGLPALQAITTDNRTFELIPNVNLYADGAGDPVWRNNGGAGPDGGSIVVASTVYELSPITSDLEDVTFEFNIDAYDLDSGRYEFRGFVQVLDSVSGSFGVITADGDIYDGGDIGPISLTINAGGLDGQLLQAGWSITGLNANPSDDWGSVTVTATKLEVTSSDVTGPIPDPMGFFVEPYAISSNAITMTASTAVDDIYAVEYLFSNTVNVTSSGWQSDPVWTDTGPDIPPATNVVELMSDPTYLALNGNWEGFAGSSQTPSSFVTATGGVATVTPGSAVEWNFYQTFGAGPAGNDALVIGQPYEFSIVSDNDTTVGTSSAVAFVKAFDSGWGFLGGEFKQVTLAMDGSATTISFTPAAGAFYQVGTFTVGTTAGSYDVSSPSLITTNIVPGTSGLIPDTEYTYRVKARDMSPQLNETAWSAPVSATSTVTDVTAPAPDPMSFAVLPAAVSDTAISMTASTATDDAFGVEYLFSNTVNNTTSGWLSSPSWTAGSIAIENADFESGGVGYEFNSGGPASAATTNISGNTAALITSDGGWAVAVKAITNLASAGFAGGDTITVAADVRALAGKNGGGAGFKIESWESGSQINTTGDVFISPTESWANYSIDYTIAAGADEIRIVLLVVAGSDSEYLYDNLAAYSGGPLNPGTEYTYVVKARDTSPNYNETAFSAPASATTTGMAPVIPFSIDSSEYLNGIGFAFGWQGTSGYTYDLQYTTNLVTGPWLLDPSPGASGILSSGGTESATSTVSGVSVFYRVITQ